MQENRLFRILYYIVQHQKTTAPQLAEAMEVSIRTIYRDIDAISSAGIPIYATQGKGGGIFIAPSFTLDKSYLSKEEKEQVMMALQAFSITSQPDDKALMTKLGSLFQASNKQWIEIDFSNWKKGSIDQSAFHQIKDAIFTSTIITFQYFNNHQIRTLRKVAPLRLLFKNQDWYLYGYCYTREANRYFKLTRMKELTIQEEHFFQEIQAPDSILPQTILEDTILVLLKFDKALAYRIYDEFQEDVVREEDDYLYVETKLPDHDRLFSYIFSFGDGVEVVKPDYIRERIKEKLKKMYKKY